MLLCLWLQREGQLFNISKHYTATHSRKLEQDKLQTNLQKKKPNTIVPNEHDV
jgi:hypothetical protein